MDERPAIAFERPTSLEASADKDRAVIKLPASRRLLVRCRHRVLLSTIMIAIMAKIERVRESWSRPITKEYLAEQASFGWKLVSVVWEREIEADPGEPSFHQEDTPYGLRVAADGVHLEENTAELEVLLEIMEGIVRDRRISVISDDLNRRGFRTRTGSMWTPASVFSLLPRLIEIGPHMFNSQEWIIRREKISQVR